MKIDSRLAKGLVREQFPEWSGLEVRPVEKGGWDNRTFHLGGEMLIRLPSQEWYAPQVEKEQEWLPRLKTGLDLEIPVPLALGKACDSFPWPWSIYRWIEGETATIECSGDLELFAADLASFLNELQGLDGTGGPEPGKDNFYRGGNLSIYDLETRKCLDALSEEIDGDWAGGVWKEALTSRFRGEPVWLHGDLATGNLLTRGGRLAAVIDFGLCAVGDPACDLVLAWNLFEGRSLEVFRRNLRVDESCWTRAKGWALWKALLMLLQRKSPEEVLQAERTLAHLKADSL